MIVAAEPPKPAAYDRAERREPRLFDRTDEPQTAADGNDLFHPEEILSSIGDVLYAWRLDTDVLTWAPNAAAVLGVVDPTSIATGRAFAQLVDTTQGRSRSDAILTDGRRDEGEGVDYLTHYALCPPDAETPIWVEDVGRWFAGPDGKPVRAHGAIRVINERHAREQRLAYLAHYDALTGELNRGQLIEVLRRCLADSVRTSTSCGFLLAAIDNLRQINDAFGFDVADEVIAAVAKRMRSRLRGKDCLGRFSGNKFGVILHGCTLEDMEAAAERLLSSVRTETVPTKAGPVSVTVTIGGVSAPRHAHTVNEILTRVQDALDGAKAKRRGWYQAYRPNPERELQRQEAVRATEEIVSALNERRVLIAFEPVVWTQTRQPAFYECLMRIKRPDGSLIHANEIVPVAERLGLVRLLDHRAAELVVEELVGAPDLKASLNVSPASTTDPDWWNGLTAMLSAHPGVAERLIVEITEMAVIHDVDDTRGFVTRVKDLGCRIAMDDFGAGYTSFRNLRKLGVDIVKIDGVFVHNLRRSEDDRAFVHTLIDLAKRLDLETVAEWVQDEVAATMLAGWGCDYLQGELVGLATSERPWARRKSRRARAG